MRSLIFISDNGRNMTHSLWSLDIVSAFSLLYAKEETLAYQAGLILKSIQAKHLLPAEQL
jgi:hypothetical protein